MEFGDFPLYKALGVKLAFPVVCGDRVFDKGHELTAQDLTVLRYNDVQSVVGARLQPSDVEADTAAEMLLKSLAGDYTRYVNVKDGYSEIYADADGVFVCQPERLSRFNEHCEQISLATAPLLTPVYKNQLIATLRIISPAVDGETLAQAVTKITGMGALLKIAPYKFRETAVVRTLNAGEEPTLKIDPKILKKLETCGLQVTSFESCPHNKDKIENAVRNALEKGARNVLCLSFAAPADRNDIIPVAFKESAADIDRFGLPLDPVVPAVFAHKKDARLIGLKESDLFTPAFDRILRFLATDTMPDASLLPSLAQNSLSLQRSIQFITPEQEKNSVAVGALDKADKIAVLILAAGSSRRMMGQNKLLQSLGGVTVVEQTVRNALASKADYVYVVTGHQAQIIERRLKDYDVKTVRNTDYASGVLSSARLGLSMMPADVAGALVLPADMPAFTEEYIDAMIDGFNPAEKRKVCVPVFNKVRYNPVLWARDLFPAFKIVPEDSHWSPVLMEHSDYLFEMELDDVFAVTDINTQGDWSSFSEQVDFAPDAETDLAALEALLNKKS